MDRDLLQGPLHLAVLGWPVGGSQQDVRQIGERVYLPPGIWHEHDGLILNHTVVPLGATFRKGQWVIEGYQLWDSPEPGGQRLATLPLSFASGLTHGGLGGLPPGALQFLPGLTRQPVWGVSTMERNPWPAWVDRIHLYTVPSRQFDCTAVLYRDEAGLVRSVELLEFTLNPERHPRPRRVWIRLDF